MLKSLYLAIYLLVLLSGCTEQEASKKVSLKPSEQKSFTVTNEQDQIPKKYYFGFDLRLAAKDDVKIYLPFLKYLSDHTGLVFLLKLSMHYESNLEKFGNGQIDFAALGPVSAIIAMDKYRAKCLVIGLNGDSKPEYKAVIFTSLNSTINSLSDIKGKSFAFGDRLSTQGHIIPRKMLEDAGITLKDFSRYTYTGSHANTAKAVINGNYDAGALQDNMAYRLEKESRIKILSVSKPYPSSLICSRGDIPGHIIGQIKKALLEFSPQGKHKDLLYDWHKTEMPMGFAPLQQEQLNEVRGLIKRYGIMSSN